MQLTYNSIKKSIFLLFSTNLAEFINSNKNKFYNLHVLIAYKNHNLNIEHIRFKSERK